MASYLGKYDGCASQRTNKFLRAVDSWINQTHYLKELIIVSDGCEKTNSLYSKHYAGNKDIKLVTLQKQPLFSGSVRQAGIKAASGDIINYLDTDDYFTPSHISTIENNMFDNGFDWCYYSDYVKIGESKTAQRQVSIHTKGLVGTSNIAHKKELEKASWDGCDGYGHDFDFIQRLRSGNYKHERIYGCGYVVCHTVNGVDY